MRLHGVLIRIKLEVAAAIRVDRCQHHLAAGRAGVQEGWLGWGLGWAARTRLLSRAGGSMAMAAVHAPTLAPCTGTLQNKTALHQRQSSHSYSRPHPHPRPTTPPPHAAHPIFCVCGGGGGG